MTINTGYVTQGFEKFCKRRKKKADYRLFLKYLDAALDESGIDISNPAFGRNLFEVLFIEAHQIRKELETVVNTVLSMLNCCEKNENDKKVRAKA